MPTYLVEFFLPRDRHAEAASLARAVEQSAGRGQPARLIQAVSVQLQEFCLALYDAATADDVDAAMRSAGLRPNAPPEQVCLLDGLERLDIRKSAAPSLPEQPAGQAAHDGAGSDR